MTDMTIHLTVPVYIDGAFAFEFEAAVDVDVTYWGHKPYFDPAFGVGDPGSGPEWEVTAHYVDCGSFDSGLKRWIADLRPAPDWAVSLIDEYVGTREGGDSVAEKIEEERRAA